MAASDATVDVQVEGVSFPPSVHAPGSTNTFFLAGAGARGLEIEGKFIKFTAIGVYLEDTTSLSALSTKWKGKTADELSESVEFCRDIVTGPFEKFTRVTMILPLTGAQYSEKVTENCVKIWKSIGIYTDEEGQAAEKFREIFKDQTFPPGSSILFTQSPAGKLTIAFSKDGSVPAVENGVVENRAMSEAVLESIIGVHGVSPEAKRSLAERMAAMLAGFGDDVQVEGVSFPPSVHAPGSTNTFFLAGAGARGLEIEGKFIKFTAIGVYLEDTTSLSALSTKWKGKTADELSESVEFCRDIVTGPFEKFTRVTMILPLTGAQYSEKVTENCVKIWKSIGIYTDEEGQAAEKFREIFKDQTFPPGSSILFTQSPAGKLTIAFSKDGSMPEVENGVVENRAMSEAVLESIIGVHGVSPEAKRSLAERLAAML